MTLAARLAEPRLLAPGVHDALSALLAAQAGFSGRCTSAARPSPTRG